MYERPVGSGVWYIRYADQYGKIRREKAGAKSLAKKLYSRRKAEVAEGRHFPEKARRREVLASDHLDCFLDEHVRGRIKSVQHNERYALLWKNSLKGKTLREIIPSDIARHIAYRSHRDGMANATINREIAFIKKFLRVAMEDGLIETNPASTTKKLKEDNGRLRYLRDGEERTLRDKFPAEHWPKVLVAMHTGLRRGNLFRLRWTEVNFDTGVVTALHSKSGEHYHVPMNDEVRETLRTLPSRLRSPWVFPSENPATPMDSQNFVNRVFGPALKRAGITDFRWHDLRHTFASRLVMAGVDIRTVQTLMGHKTIEMTLRYAHLSPGHLQDAVRQLDAPRTDTPTDTSLPGIDAQRKSAVQDTVTKEEIGGDGWTRTIDLGIMRPSL